MKNFIRSYCQHFLLCKRAGANQLALFVVASLALVSAIGRIIYDIVRIMTRMPDPNGHVLLIPSLCFGGFALLLLGTLPFDT